MGTPVKHYKSSPPEPQTLAKRNRSSLPEPESSIYSSHPTQIQAPFGYYQATTNPTLATTKPLPSPLWLLPTHYQAHTCHYQATTKPPLATTNPLPSPHLPLKGPLPRAKEPL